MLKNCIKIPFVDQLRRNKRENNIYLRGKLDLRKKWCPHHDSNAGPTDYKSYGLITQNYSTRLYKPSI